MEAVTSNEGPAKDDHIALKAALWAVEQERQADSPKVANGQPYPYSSRSAAEKFGASRSSVARHMRALRAGRPAASSASGKKRGRPTKVTPAEDRILAAFARSVQKTGAPCERTQVKAFVNEMMALSIPPRKPMTKKWLSKWLRAHPELQVKSRNASASFAAKTATSARRWFDQVMEQNVNQNDGTFKPMRFTAVQIQRTAAPTARVEEQQAGQPEEATPDAQVDPIDENIGDSEDGGNEDENMDGASEDDTD